MKFNGFRCEEENNRMHYREANIKKFVTRAAWAPGAGEYLRDCIDIFEEYGWDWCYHAFREWEGWSVEREGLNWRGLLPSADNQRKQALLKGFKSK